MQCRFIQGSFRRCSTGRQNYRDSRLKGKIDKEFEKQTTTVKDYWIHVLKRIISVIKFLASRKLAFRGTDEQFSEKRNGNYLNLLELLAEYYPFLKDHINGTANLIKGKTSYLSEYLSKDIHM